MRRATTPTHTFTFPEEVDVSTLADLTLSYSQDGKIILEKSLSNVEVSASDNAISYTFTQAEANAFAPGKALAQVRVKDQGGSVLASQMIWLDIKPVLNSEVM